MVPAPQAEVSAGPQSGQVRSFRRGGKTRVVETWYDHDPVSFEGHDLWICYQRSQPVSSFRWQYKYTIQVDLTLEPGVLLSSMRKNNSREIRQAQDRDELTSSFITSPSVEEVLEFATFYDSNPHGPHQEPADRDRLLTLLKAGLVHLAQVRDAQGTVLSQHCLLWLSHSRTIRLMSLASLHHAEGDQGRRAAIGRANRLLFFRAFLFYKEQGADLYDFGGWYAGTEDEKRLKINQFKEGFRGKILYGYDCEEPVSLRGWIYVILQGVKRRLFQPEVMKEIKQRRKKAAHLPEP